MILIEFHYKITLLTHQYDPRGCMGFFHVTLSSISVYKIVHQEFFTTIVENFKREFGFEVHPRMILVEFEVPRYQLQMRRQFQFLIVAWYDPCLQQKST